VKEVEEVEKPSGYITPPLIISKMDKKAVEKALL